MVRRRWLIAQVALLGVLATLVLPSSSSALAAVFISLTPTGPSPATLTIPAGLYPVWMNQDTVTHTVTFASGCSIQVAPGELGQSQCTSGLGGVVGDHPYTVDAKAQGNIVVVARGRTVTLEAKRHRIARGSELLLHGKLTIEQLSPPMVQGPRMPVTVLARPDRFHPFHRIAVVMAKPRSSVHSLSNVYSAWHLRVRPRMRMIYIAEANSQPASGQYWQQAWSKPFRVGVAKR
jgi:plastocyanin